MQTITQLAMLRQNLLSSSVTNNNKNAKVINNEKAIMQYFNKIYDSLVNNNPYKVVLAMAQFGEFIQREYPNGLPNDDTIADFLKLFSQFELPDLSTLKSIQLIINSILTNDKRFASTSGIRKGLDGFKEMLDDVKVSGALSNTQEKNKDTIKEFIEKDFVPNTPLRKGLEKSIRQIRVSASETFIEENKYIANSYVDKASEMCDDYFSDPHKFKYDLVLMSIDANQDIDLDHLNEISQKNNDSPILIKKADAISVYGFSNGKWQETSDLVSHSFEHLKFPQINAISVVKATEITKEMHQEIKKGHTQSKSQVFYDQMCHETQSTAKQLPSRFQDGLQKVLLWLEAIYEKVCKKKKVRASPEIVNRTGRWAWGTKTHVGDIHETLLHHKKDLTEEPTANDNPQVDNDLKN